MKIFEFDWGKLDVTDWMYAIDEEDAKEVYLRVTGCGNLEGCAISEVPQEKWSQMNILDINEMEPDDDQDYNEEEYESGYKIIESFAEYAERNTISDLIVSTEF